MRVSDASQLPEKKDVCRSFLLRGTVFLHLDPRRTGVVVPAWFRNQPQLVLQIGLDMPIPISDLRVDDAGVTGSLSFSRNLCLCVIPWESVFAIVGEDGRGMVWPECMPTEIAAEVEHEAGRNRLRDASKPAPSTPSLSADLRGRATAPAPSAGRAPEIRLAPTPAPVAAVDRAESAIRKPRKPAIAAATSVPSQPAPNVRTPAKQARRSTDTGTGNKRPLPPYLRVVK